MAMAFFALAIFLILGLDLDELSPSSASAASSETVEITYGTVLKLMHEKTKIRLHSHDVPYGSGSGQQSVTGFPNIDDSNSYWIVRPTLETSSKQGDSIKSGTIIRLQHMRTRKWLHSHLHASPITGNLEVSCFGGEHESDTGDYWRLLIEGSGKTWKQDQRIRLQHVDTGAYLHSHDKKYQRIAGGEKSFISIEADLFFHSENSETMKAVVITTPGNPEVLQVQEVDDPQIKDDEVLIKVEAAGLNRADILQRKGSYPPPKGASPYPGLECSGTIEYVGKNVSGWKIGDQVCALLTGGGYAEKVAVPAGQVLPVPSGVSLKDAAAFPEVACTVWSTVFMTSHLSTGETFLVHGGSSGIGTFAIQIAKCHGVRVFITAGSEEKLAFCKNLGADVCINYKTEDFVARVKEETGGKGVDVILDCMGASYFQPNLDSLNIDGRLFVIGTQGGAKTELSFPSLFAKRLTVQAAGLRSRSTENKSVIVSEVKKNVWPAIAAGKVKPVIYKYFPLSEAAEAHKLMESSKHIGKILLVP